MQHNTKDLAIKIIFGFAKDKVPSDIGMGALSLALIMSAKEKGFTDEQILDAFKNNMEQLNKDLAKS